MTAAVKGTLQTAGLLHLAPWPVAVHDLSAPSQLTPASHMTPTSSSSCAAPCSHAKPEDPEGWQHRPSAGRHPGGGAPQLSNAILLRTVGSTACELRLRLTVQRRLPQELMLALSGRSVGLDLSFNPTVGASNGLAAILKAGIGVPSIKARECGMRDEGDI